MLLSGRVATGIAALAMAALLGVASCVAGCGSAEVAENPVLVDEAVPDFPAPVSPMPVDERRRALPSGFPLEIPVADGRVLSAELASASPTGLYSYEIEIDASPEQALEWYRDAYLGANWSGVGSVTTGDVLSGLSFAKGGLGSMVHAEPVGSGNAVVRVDFGGRTLVEQQTF